MIYAVTDLVKEIRVALDNNMSSEALAGIGDVDTLSLDELIKSKIEDAGRAVVQSAPVSMLGGGKAFGDTIGWDSEAGYGSGHIVLPDDFLRLIVFQMSDWSISVSEPITEHDPLYSRQRSRYGGVRGCPQKPVVAIVQQPIGQVLEFFSCTGGEHVYVKMARYAPMPKIETYNGEEVIDLPEKIKRPVVYEAAYLVALATQDTEHAKGYLAVCQELLGVI